MTRNEKEEKQTKLINKMKYNKGKAKAIDEAIEWQREASEKCLSYSELYEAGEYFTKLAKRYGLIKEFKENGII